MHRTGSTMDDDGDDSGSTMLFTGNVKLARTDRFSLKEGDESTLVIDGVTAEDAGVFVCRIMVRDEVNLAHVLNVVEAFNVLPVRFRHYFVFHSPLAVLNEYIIWHKQDLYKPLDIDRGNHPSTK